MLEVNIAHVGILAIPFSKNSMSNTTMGVRAISAFSTEIGTRKIDFPKIGSIQDNLAQNSPTEIDSTKIDASKVTFSISLSSEQFLRSHFPAHHLTFNGVSHIKDSSTHIRSNLLNSDIPRDITLKVSDLLTVHPLN